MKLFTLVAVCLSSVALGFSPRPALQSRVTSTVVLEMASKQQKKVQEGKKKKKKISWIEHTFNNFEPVHGHGSGEDELDAIWKEEQALLKDRRKKRQSSTMRKKYKKFDKDHHNEIRTHSHNPADLNKKEDDAMYIDDSYDIKVPNMHIEEAADKLVDGFTHWADDVGAWFKKGEDKKKKNVGP